jgi:hypothetical protein
VAARRGLLRGRSQAAPWICGGRRSRRSRWVRAAGFRAVGGTLLLRIVRRKSRQRRVALNGWKCDGVARNARAISPRTCSSVSKTRSSRRGTRPSCNVARSAVSPGLSPIVGSNVVSASPAPPGRARRFSDVYARLAGQPSGHGAAVTVLTSVGRPVVASGRPSHTRSQGKTARKRVRSRICTPESPRRPAAAADGGRAGFSAGCGLPDDHERAKRAHHSGRAATRSSTQAAKRDDFCETREAGRAYFLPALPQQARPQRTTGACCCGRGQAGRRRRWTPHTLCVTLGTPTRRPRRRRPALPRTPAGERAEAQGGADDDCVRELLRPNHGRARPGTDSRGRHGEGFRAAGGASTPCTRTHPRGRHGEATWTLNGTRGTLGTLLRRPACSQSGRRASPWTLNGTRGTLGERRRGPACSQSGRRASPWTLNGTRGTLGTLLRRPAASPSADGFHQMALRTWQESIHSALRRDRSGSEMLYKESK